MGRIRVKQRTKFHKKRRGFCGIKEKDDTVVNSNSTSVNNPVNMNSQVVNDTVNNNDLSTAENMSFNNTDTSTASRRKIIPIVASTPTASEGITGYRVMDMEILSDVFNLFPCPSCFKTTMLKISEINSKKKGLASFILIQCQSCSFFHEFYTSSSKDSSFDINKRIAYSMRACGQGYGGLEKFVSLMNLPKPMTANNYDKIIAKLSNAAKEVANDSMQDASQELHRAVSASSDDVIDVAVSCDGTWQRRGFSSLNGVVAAISMETGKIVDIEAMTRSCRACCLKENLKISDPQAYADWKNSHTCKFSYQGTAGNMEPVGAQRMWERSIEKNKLRYTELYGDGDSKSYSSVCDVYPGVKVEKLECVGHVQKRVGCRLRNLKKKEKGLGGKGKLTNNTIDRLQNYYGIAIRQNKNKLESMQKAVQTTLFHVASSKANNWHYPHCPEGSDSWCKFNQDKANGTKSYKPGPGLPMDIVMKLKPVFEELSDHKLLKKCLHGLTQNQNESLNSMIWERIPKTRFVSILQLELGVYDAVSNFNMGRKASILLYEKLDMIPGRYTLNGCKNINNKILFTSEYKNLESSKIRRKIIRGKSKRRDDKNEEKDGETYAAGAF